MICAAYRENAVSHATCKSWLTLVSLRHRRQNLISTRKKFCSASGGIGKAYCITSCYSRVKQSRQTITKNNWPIYWPFTGQGIHKVLFMIMLDHSLRKPLRTISLHNAGNFSHTRRIAQTWHLPTIIYSGHCSIIWLIDISRDLKRYDNALMTLSLQSRSASIVKKFASYRKDGKRSLMKIETVLTINIFFCFLINVEF